MTLFDWIDKSGRTYVDIAAELGWSYARLSRLARGLVRVDEHAARQIVALTQGAVPIGSVLRPAPVPRVAAVPTAAPPAVAPRRRGAARKPPVVVAPEPPPTPRRAAPVAPVAVTPAPPPRRRGAARKPPVVVAAVPEPPGRRGRPRQQPVVLANGSARGAL